MQNIILHKKLKELIDKNDYYSSMESIDVYDRKFKSILIEFKNNNGQRQEAKKVLKNLAELYSHDTDLQDIVYNIYDIVTGWCIPELIIWEKEKDLNLKDNLIYEDGTTGVIFNHYSFCEILKHTMVKYGEHTYDEASKKIIKSWHMQVPNSIRDVSFITHELDYHWAMIAAYGDGYWIDKGIPSSFIDFRDEYFIWYNEIKLKYNLNDIYEYYDILTNENNR